MTRHQLISECDRRLARGENIEHTVKFLRDAGCSKMQSISLLENSNGIGLAKARVPVHFSTTWYDVLVDDERFQDGIENHLKAISIQPLKSAADFICNMLNSEGISPNTWRSRNHFMYELICYINNLVECELSHNQARLELFFEKAKTFVENHSRGFGILDPQVERYFDLFLVYIHNIEARTQT